MLCDSCKKNEATVHLTQIVENKMQTIDLCEACSKAKGVDDPAGFSLASLLVGLGASQEEAAAAVAAPEMAADLACPKCGFTAADFKKAGRLGCADCYQTFAEQLDGLLKTMHKGTLHKGKIPGSARTRDTAEKVRQLQFLLDQAVKTEDFERAAQLRDEIKKLKVPAGPLPTV
jgi:protein arginine kinase activator